MADETVKPDVPKPAISKPGFDKPIPDPGEGKVPDHIHPETLMAKGIDPDTKQRVSINLAVMKEEFGEKKGTEKYNKIAVAGGFFNPNAEPVGSGFTPDLQLEGMKPSLRAKIDDILKEN